MATFTLFKRQDWFLNTALFGLVAISLLVLRSIGKELFIQQIGWAVIAVLVIFICAHIDWRALAAYRWIIVGLYVLAIVLLAATYFFAPPIRHTRAWLVLGPLQFQVSEFVKVVMIIFFAYFFAKRHIGIARLGTIIRPFIYFLIPALFVLAQPDMGTAIVLFCIWAGYIVVSGLPIKHLLVGFLGIVLIVILAWFSVLKPYQKERIVGLFQPNYDPLGVNYSTIQSKIAVGSGGWFGKGFGQGTQVQLGFLPEAGTDYIIASLVEEWGFFGGLVAIGLFLLLIMSIIRVGLAAENNFYRFVCLGACILFLTQFAINLGSALGLLPVIGITFPFLSYGGSSLLMNAMVIGIVQSAAVHRALA